MTDTPPQSDTDVEPDRPSSGGTSRWQKVVGAIGLVVILWVGTQMYGAVFGGVGGGDHAPGQETPVENQEPEIDVEDDGGHDPSQRDH
jgi:hypothetical protein